MIVVHHLNESRSQRIVWLLEELGLAYEIRHCARNAQTRLESGAIVDSLIRRHGGSRLAPAQPSADHETCSQWLHYAEGSAMLPLLLRLYVSRLCEAGAPLQPRIDSELAKHLGYVDAALAGREWLVGGQLSGADIQMSFVGEAARGLRAGYPHLDAWVRRCQQRPACRRALARGGPYADQDVAPARAAEMRGPDPDRREGS
jgi:glutathione S-transferase